MWLNEGFASYMEYVASDKVKPEMGMVSLYVLKYLVFRNCRSFCSFESSKCVVLCLVVCCYSLYIVPLIHFFLQTTILTHNSTLCSKCTFRKTGCSAPSAPTPSQTPIPFPPRPTRLTRSLRCLTLYPIAR